LVEKEWVEDSGIDFEYRKEPLGSRIQSRMRLPSTINLPNSFSPSPCHLRNHRFLQSKEQLESRANVVALP
jgi:hypothetical protein